MPKKSSAGILLYRHPPDYHRDDLPGRDRDDLPGRDRDDLEVFLVHPGGPFWAKKDLGSWSLPKGEFADGEDPLATAIREFLEETGFPDSFPVSGPFQPLRPLRQAGGKTVYAWAVEGDCDPALLRSNLFSMEWPPKSGLQREFPEVDRAAWFPIAEARAKILAGQAPFLDELQTLVGLP